MKTIGVVLIAIGIALFVFTLYSFFKDSQREISPIPESRGVKVIFISPQPSQ